MIFQLTWITKRPHLTKNEQIAIIAKKIRRHISHFFARTIFNIFTRHSLLTFIPGLNYCRKWEIISFSDQYFLDITCSLPSLRLNNSVIILIVISRQDKKIPEFQRLIELKSQKLASLGETAYVREEFTMILPL